MDMDGDRLNEGNSDINTTGDDLADLNDPTQDAMGQGDEENSSQLRQRQGK